jgi:hypothetical protein
MGEVAHAQPLEQRQRLPLGLAPGDPVHPAGGEGEVVEHPQMREQVVGLEHHTDAALQSVASEGRIVDPHAVEPDLAVVGLDQPVEAAQQRGLARARSADQRQHPSGLEVEVDPVEHQPGAVVLGQAAHAQPGGHAASLSRRSRSRRFTQSANRAIGIVASRNSPAATT